jgi:hypothetical protein
MIRWAARLLAVVVVAAALVVLADVVMPPSSRNVLISASDSIAPNSLFRTRIADSAPTAPNSAQIVQRIGRGGAFYANLTEFGIPIYLADGSTPVHRVRCTITDWGRCPFEGYEVPIPDGAAAHKGSDGAMVVVDLSAGLSFEFWQAKRDGSQWTTSFGAVNRLDGSGWSDGSSGYSTGSGSSRLAGVIRMSEIENGEIPHALAVQSKFVCADVFRPPAVKSDGTDRLPDCIPEGARIRLDPKVSLDGLGLAPAVRTVARALQTYGAYVVDVGGAPLSVSFELDTNAAPGSIGAVYSRAGLRWDYDDMSRIPLMHLQVLA